MQVLCNIFFIDHFLFSSITFSHGYIASFPVFTIHAYAVRHADGISSVVALADSPCFVVFTAYSCFCECFKYFHSLTREFFDNGQYNNLHRSYARVEPQNYSFSFVGALGGVGVCQGGEHQA